MRRCIVAVAALAALTAVVVGGQLFAFQNEDAKAKYTIKQVMAGAHKSKLLNKVMEGDASQDEKLKLLDHYISLAENKPIKGTQKSWEEKTNAIVLAAAKAAVGRDDGSELLQKVTNCMACHKEHKPAQ